MTYSATINRVSAWYPVAIDRYSNDPPMVVPMMFHPKAAAALGVSLKRKPKTRLAKNIGEKKSLMQSPQKFHSLLNPPGPAFEEVNNFRPSTPSSSRSPDPQHCSSRSPPCKQATPSSARTGFHTSREGRLSRQQSQFFPRGKSDTLSKSFLDHIEYSFRLSSHGVSSFLHGHNRQL